MSIIQNFDINILNFISHHLHNSLLDKIIPVITTLGNNGMIWIILSLPLLISKKYRHVGFMTLGALLLTYLVGDGILKHLFQRPRPFVSMPALDLLIAKPQSYSFPSGHTSSSFAAVGILWREFKQYRIPMVILAALIAFSRMYLFVHYPTDILGGIIVGLFCSWIVFRIYKAAVRKSSRNSSTHSMQ